MHLGNEREAALGDAGDIIEPLDNPKLPQWFGQIKRAGVKAGDLNAELPPVTGLGQRDVTDMILKIEIAILNPVRMIKIKRHPHQFLAETARAAQSPLDKAQYVFESDSPARRRRRIINRDRPNVHRRCGCFEIHETRILSAELKHIGPLSIFCWGEASIGFSGRRVLPNDPFPRRPHRLMLSH